MRQLREALDQAARSLGFDRLAVAQAFQLDTWKAQAGESAHWAHLTHDPQALMPGARRAILLLRGYRPYAPRPGLVTLSAYYPCSQRAYMDAPALAQLLVERGYRALCHPPLPHKPLMALAGAARYGVNGLTAAAKLGTRFAVQVILTDAPLAIDPPCDALPAPCEGCGLCAARCPVGALGRGKVDVEKCLRALDEGAPVPEPLRPLLSNSLLGCDLCQDICPRNQAVSQAPMPQQLSRALALDRLLRGEVKPLAGCIGANYARKKRLQARACLAAANLGRADCLPLLMPLQEDPYPPLADHARWAVARLQKG